MRAIAESRAEWRWMMLVTGIAYAMVWLVWAVRSHRSSHFASVVFGLTAALILPPLLWEGTVRFHELSVGVASLVLVGEVVLSLGLAWTERLEAIPWIGTVSAVATAMGLIVATHELRPLTIALLALALVTEVAAASGRWLGLRVVTALAADSAVGLLGLLMTSAERVPDTYRAMSAGELNAYCAALMTIYCGSIGVRAFVMKRKLTFAEIVQAAVAFVLGTWVSLRATHGESSSVLGAVFLLLAVGCYWGALERFSGAEGRRNRHVSANYAACLVLAGNLLLLKGNFQAMALSVAAIVRSGDLHANKILESWDSRNAISTGRWHRLWTVHLRNQRARRQGSYLAGMEFLGRGLGWAGELCTGITGFGRRMEGSDVVGPARSSGGECAGSTGSSRVCGACLGGVERLEIIDGAHGGNLRDRTGVGIRGIAVEPRGTGMGGVWRDRIRCAEAGRRRFALWKRRDAHGVFIVLRIDSDFATTADAVWKNRSVRVRARPRLLGKRERRIGKSGPFCDRHHLLQ